MMEVLILGAGYAGLRALRELQLHHDIKITLVDRNDYHYEATNLHEVAAGTQPAEAITYPIEEVVNHKCTQFVQGEVAKILPEKQLVKLDDGQELSYDYLIVALGFESESFGIEGVTDYCLKMDDVDSAEAIQRHLHAMMIKYQETNNPEYLKIIVAGAGFTGTELLGALLDARENLAEIAKVNPDQIELFCVDSGKQYLPMFSEKLSAYGMKHLQERGVKFFRQKRIQAVTDDVVTCEDGTELTAKTIIWTTGVSGSHVIKDSGFSAKRNRIAVTENLRDPDNDRIYFVGDVAFVLDATTGKPYPTTAQLSLKMGHYVAKDILSREAGKQQAPFVFHSLGTVASIGNTDALGIVGPAEVKGYPASFVKKAIMDRSLMETGGVKEMLSKGRADFYH